MSSKLRQNWGSIVLGHSGADLEESPKSKEADCVANVIISLAMWTGTPSFPSLLSWRGGVREKN